MLSFDRWETLTNRLGVKHRDTNDMVKFIYNPNQATLQRLQKKQYEQIKKTRVVILKSRRVGMSSKVEADAFCHCYCFPNREAKIVAHLAKTADSLFRVPRDLARCIPWFPPEDIQARRIFFAHPDGNSLLHVATAGTPGAGRGDTLSFLHLSEAAKFPGDESFLSLLPSVSKGDDTYVCIESTANGREGPGEAFADFWDDTVAGRNGYLPVFLSYLDDPACVRDPEEASDAPADDLERELMSKPFCASRAQIAWVRRTKADECRDLEPLFLQEFPHSPGVAFISTGNPAFPREELTYAQSTIKKPEERGFLRRNGPIMEWQRDGANGNLVIWEFPYDDHGRLRDDHYCIGADAALGTDEGDFAAFVVLNKSTGNIAARFAERIHPELLADQLDMVGRWYKRAMVNVELTGNLGRWTQKLLRDTYRYPLLYSWKGKDDRKVGRDKGAMLGFETNQATRRMLFDAFRSSLREGLRHEPGGLQVNDEQLMSQMRLATIKDWSWEVRRGHDDILFAAMLTVLTAKQYPAPRLKYVQKRLETGFDERRGLPPAVPDVAFELVNHWKEVMREGKRQGHGAHSTLRGEV